MNRFSFFLILMIVPSFLFAQKMTGKVTDLAGTGLIDASIVETGTLNQVSSNELGFFNITPESGNSTLTISRIGYKSQVIDASEGDIEIKLQKDYLKLDRLNLFAPNYDLVDSLNNLLVGSSKSFVVKEKYAEYPGKWDRFYRSVKSAITSSDGFAPESWTGDVKFTVDAVGKITDIEILSTISKYTPIIKSALEGMESFNPATQNGSPTAQHFNLEIRDDKFMQSDQPPLPVGGYAAFGQYLSKNMEYPQLARKTGVQGKVFIKFMIYEDGSVNEVEAIRKIGGGCDEEAVRLVSQSPKWNPATQLGKPVRQEVILPITFSLRNKQDKIVHAQFKGGQEKLEEYIRNNLQQFTIPLPINRYDNKVKLEFNIRRNGRIVEVEIEEGIGEPFDSEAVRLYNGMPNWEPARDDGVPFNEEQTAYVSFGNIPEAQLAQAREHYVDGNKLYESGDFINALDQFSLAISKNPTNLDYYFQRANTNFELKRVGQGCRDLKVIKAYDKDANFQYNKRKCDVF